MIFNKEKRKLLIVFSFLPIFTLTCIALNQILDGYFLWICISQGSLMIYWQGSLIHTFQIGFSLRLPLWIPLLPLLVLILYNIIVSRSVKIKFSFRGMRVHHYLVGLLSLLIAASLTVMSMTIANEPTILFLGWKRTSTAQMLHSSSFLLNIGGVTLILLDLKDLASTLATHIHKNLRKDDSKNKGDCNEEY